MTTTADLPALPSIVVGQVHHTRHRPVRHSFTHKHTQWLVDLDDMPRVPLPLRPFATFRAEDHLAGNPGVPALKANVLRVLERDGVTTSTRDRVVMLSHARVLGHVFDPMSAFWVFAPDGALRAVLVEVHNTYGGRHAYVLRPDEDGRASMDKDFYVSPFNDVEGEYAIRLTLTPGTVGVAIRLRTRDEPLVTATVTGRPRAATTAQVARTALRYPLMPQRVTALIRVHGIWLWLRRLPVRPRPENSLETVR